MLTCAAPPTATTAADDQGVEALTAERSRLLRLLWRVDELRARLVARVRAVDTRIREARQKGAPPSQ